MKKLFLMICLLIVTTLGAEEAHKVTVLAKIHPDGTSSLQHAMKFKDAALSQKLKQLAPDEEVLLQGEIFYEKVKGTDGQLQPVFVIDSVRPISLRKLGKMDDFKVSEKTVTFTLKNPNFAPKALNMPEKAVGAITMTASILMLKSLTTNAATEPRGRDQMNSALIFSAGALAAGSFILEELLKSSK
jgi:hypothetical protein